MNQNTPPAIRGGSWSDFARLCRSAFRIRLVPGCRGIGLGFRVVSYAINKTRVIRGGSWDSSARFCRSACRDQSGPGGLDDDLGFRIIQVSE